MGSDVRDNGPAGRFELAIGGQLAFANYRLTGSTLTITHVEAAVALRGTGAADRLMRGIMEHARRDGLKIVPLCSYAAAWARRNPAFQDLLAA
jgi:predicted GNAT family acetyltransferase